MAVPPATITASVVAPTRTTRRESARTPRRGTRHLRDDPDRRDALHVARGEEGGGASIGQRGAHAHRLPTVRTDDVGHGSISQESALPDDQQMVRGLLHLAHLAHEVCGDQDRAPFAGEAAEPVADHRTPSGSSPLTDLVEDEDPSVAQQRPGDPQPLSHAERVGPGSEIRT